MSLQASRYLRSSSVASGGPKLVLGLSVSHSTTGFAMVRLHNGDALRFGVIDTRQAILDGGDPKKIATIPESPFLSEVNKNRVLQVTDTICAALERMKEAGYSFSAIGLEDNVKDRSVANTKRDLSNHVEVSKIQGIILSEISRMWQNVPILQVHPAEARSRVFGENRVAARDAARARLFGLAKEKIPAFPAVKTRNGKVDVSSYYMSDAWATALFTRTQFYMDRALRNEEVTKQLREQVMGSKEIRRLQEAARTLHPRSSASQLEDCLEKRVQQMIRSRAYKMALADDVRIEERVLKEMARARGALHVGEKGNAV